MTYDVYLSVGSNIRPEDNIRAALKQLDEFAEIDSVSSVYRTEPVRVEPGARDFHNLCIKITVRESPSELKKRLRTIEASVGRQRSNSETELHESRKVDLDILLYDPAPEDFVAHEQVHDEAFVVFPLSDLIDPSTFSVLPDSVEIWRNRCDSDIIKETVSYHWPPEIDASN
jgi:2-amino-4-hydroxy-6-hydroxymethyldihydropteridine diphosphokinase